MELLKPVATYLVGHQNGLSVPIAYSMYGTWHNYLQSVFTTEIQFSQYKIFTAICSLLSMPLVNGYCFATLAKLNRP